MREAVRKKLEQVLSAGWAVSPPMPLYFENQKVKEEGAAWCRFGLMIGTDNPAAIGSEFTRAPAMVGLQIFVPELSGTKKANEAADRLSSTFRFQQWRINGDAAGEVLDISIESGVTGPTYKGGKDGMVMYHATLNIRVDTNAAPVG